MRGFRTRCGPAIIEDRTACLPDNATRVRAALRAYIEAQGFPPTARELADLLCLASSTVYHHLKAMEEAGEIERTPQTTRGIRFR